MTNPTKVSLEELNKILIDFLVSVDKYGEYTDKFDRDVEYYAEQLETARRAISTYCEERERVARLDEYTQSKLKAFAGEVMEAIGEDEKEFTKRSRPYEDSDTDKLWDLANGIEPISSGQISTWGGSATTQFRKFALKLRNTIWKEAELHNNELRDELRQALKAIKEKAGIE